MHRTKYFTVGTPNFPGGSRRRIALNQARVSKNTLCSKLPSDAQSIELRDQNVFLGTASKIFVATQDLLRVAEWLLEVV